MQPYFDPTKKTNQSTKINLIGCDTIVNLPSLLLLSLGYFLSMSFPSIPMVVSVPGQKVLINVNTGLSGHVGPYTLRITIYVLCFKFKEEKKKPMKAI